MGFTAHHPAGKFDYTAGDVIQFTDVQSNFGNYYDSNDCTFFVPYRGIYVFTVSVTAHGYYGLYVEIFKENVILAEAVAESSASGAGDFYQSSSIFVVVQCEKGEYVYARTGEETSDYLRAFSDRSTQFSGYLLYLN